MGWDRKDVARTTAAAEQFTDVLYHDTAVFSTLLLRRLVEDVGVEHVLLGTHHLFELGDPHPLDTVRELGLDEADERRILGGNAAGCWGCPFRPDFGGGAGWRPRRRGRRSGGTRISGPWIVPGLRRTSAPGCRPSASWLLIDQAAPGSHAGCCRQFAHRGAGPPGRRVGRSGQPAAPASAPSR